MFQAVVCISQHGSASKSVGGKYAIWLAVLQNGKVREKIYFPNVGWFFTWGVFILGVKVCGPNESEQQKLDNLHDQWHCAVAAHGAIVTKMLKDWISNECKRIDCIARDISCIWYPLNNLRLDLNHTFLYANQLGDIATRKPLSLDNKLLFKGWSSNLTEEEGSQLHVIFRPRESLGKMLFGLKNFVKLFEQGGLRVYRGESCNALCLSPLRNSEILEASYRRHQKPFVLSSLKSLARAAAVSAFEKNLNCQVTAGAGVWEVPKERRVGGVRRGDFNNQLYFCSMFRLFVEEEVAKKAGHAAGKSLSVEVNGNLSVVAALRFFGTEKMSESGTIILLKQCHQCKFCKAHKCERCCGVDADFNHHN